MEVDELLARFYDDEFDLYRETLRDAAIVSRVKRKTTDATDSSFVTAAGKNPLPMEGGKQITRPLYEKTESIINRLNEEARSLSARLAAAEQRQLTVNDDDLETASRDSEGIAKELSVKLMHLSNLLAYDVITIRTIPENRIHRMQRTAADMLAQRNEMLSSSASRNLSSSRADTNRIMSEAVGLYNEAEKHLLESREMWPGRYGYVVLQAPRMVHTANSNNRNNGHVGHRTETREKNKKTERTTKTKRTTKTANKPASPLE
jgi:hypothetical protein